MTDNTETTESISPEPVPEAPLSNAKPEPVPESSSSSAQPAPPRASLHGNAFDLTALGALASGVLVLFLCSTCYMGLYCLPLLPLLLGIVGIATANRAVNRKQSQTMAWIGLGGGAIAILLMLAGIILYLGMILIAIWSGSN